MKPPLLLSDIAARSIRNLPLEELMVSIAAPGHSFPLPRIQRPDDPVAMTFALFLGGSRDGQRLPVASSRTVVPVSHGDGKVEIYREERLAGESSRIRLFVETRLTIAQAFATLIAGYPKPAPVPTDSRGTNDPMTWEYWRDRCRQAEEALARQ